MVTTHPQPGEIYYPEEDGKLVESDRHLKQMLHLVGVLDVFFRGRPDAFVGGDIALFYKEGDPSKYFGPDVLVALGVRPRSFRERGSYRLWEEGVPPAVIIELTSAATRQVDTVRKPRQYAALGVREYFLFDPLGEFLKPRLQGYRLNSQGRYDRLSGDELDSSELGLRLIVREGWLRLLNPATGAMLPTLEEEHEARLEKEAALAEKEAEIARLRAELERLRGAP